MHFADLYKLIKSSFGIIGLLIFLFIGVISRAQNFDVYDEYKKLSFHTSQILYAPAKTRVIQGPYAITTHPMRGFQIGLRHTFKPYKKLTWYTGLDFDWTPLFYFTRYVKQEEYPLHNLYNEKDYVKALNERCVLAVPFGLIYKKKVRNNDKMEWVGKAELKVHLFQPGDFSASISTQELDDFFTLEATNDVLSILVPTINLHGGVNYRTKVGIISLMLNIQKGIVPYYKGEYSYNHMAISNRSYGTYTMRADYIGLELGFTPKSSKKKRLNHPLEFERIKW